MEPENHPLLIFFEYKHLPASLQKISQPFSVLASHIDESMAYTLAKTNALGRLLEAKDWAIRAAIGDGALKLGDHDQTPQVPITGD